jgi:class 3 adenylate cyclase
MYKEFNFDEELQIILNTIGKLKVTRILNLDVKTVVIADLVGSTAAKDEYGHSKGMNRCRLHNLLAAETFKRFKGTIIKFIGDAVLASFSSGFNAVVASVVFRCALEAVKIPVDEFQVPLETRITLTTGAVEEFETESGHDIGGQVVDKAARIQGVVSPGQILAEVGVIEPIRLILKERMPFIKIPGNEDISELQLKGLKEPVRVLEITTMDRPYGNPPSGRGQYISSLIDSISLCKLRVWLSIRCMKSRKNRRDIGLLQDHLVEAQNRRGIDVRIINNGWDADSLETAVELESLGLKVRFCESKVDSSVNLVDKNIIIFSSKKQNRFFSKNWYWKMSSYHVNSALASDIQLRWEEAISPQLKLAEILDRSFKSCKTVIDRNEIIDHIHDRFGINKGDFIESSLELLGFIRKIRYIFIVGRPGTGKSSIRKLLIRDLENQLGAKTKALDDYDLLKKMSEADINCKRFIPQGGGGFMVKDPAVLTEVLRNISSDCLSDTDTHVTWMIEFARGQYSEAFSAFDARVLEKAVVIHISCNKNQIYERLEARARAGGANVTGDVIEKYYKEDDASYICKKMGIPCIEVDNDTPINELKAKVKMIIRQLQDIAVSIYK